MRPDQQTYLAGERKIGEARTNDKLPRGIRVDSGVEDGGEVSPFDDPMIAKLIVSEPNWPVAAAKLARRRGGSRSGRYAPTPLSSRVRRPMPISSPET